MLVAVHGYGKGDSVRSDSPIIYPNAATLPCRPAPFDLEQLQSHLQKGRSGGGRVSRNTDTDILDILNIETQDGTTAADNTGGGGISEEARQRSQPVTHSVGENWIKLGIRITNGNEQFYLIVTDITFTATATYKGQTLPPHTASIPAGYCETPGFIYFVPPGQRIDYKPYSKGDYLHNLTLYVAGFPIIDNTTETGSPVSSAAAHAGATSSSPQQSLASPRCLTFIPRYSVRTILRGHFVTKNGSKDGIWPFRKEAPLFYTTSSIPGC